MTEIVTSADSMRADIALRTRRRRAESREQKFTYAVFGILAYSGVVNVATGISLLRASPIDAALGIVLGGLYVFGAYRAWFKDDTSWWPVAVPACFTIALLSLAALGGVFRPIPVLLNILLLILVPLRARAVAATKALTLAASA